MKKAFLIVCAVLLLAGVAQGVTTVYPVFQAVMGQQTAFINGVAGAGNTTAVTVGAVQVLKLKRIDFKPDADVTGTINIQIGSTTVYAISNALAGNVYGKNLGLDYNQGALGEDLVINAPSTVRYNADYRLN